MTSRERFLAVLRGEMPDRVPLTLFIQGQGHFLTQVYPDVDPWDCEQNQRNVIEIQKQLGLDVFVRMLFGLNDPLSIHMGGLNVSRSTENWDVTTEVRRKTEQAIKIGKPGGKFILQSADFLEYGTPMENLEAYVLAAKQFCDY